MTRLGTTAADALDDFADDLEFAAAAHAHAAGRWAARAEAEPARVEHSYALVQERAKEEACRGFAKTARERARILRVHDDATTKRAVAPSAGARPWWQWWGG